MTTDNKTLADAQPGGKVRLGDQRSDLVPGIVRCAKCSFQLARTNLYMQSGKVGAGDSNTEPCPNGCGPLWPVTWETWAREGWAEAERLHLEKSALSAQPSPGGQDALDCIGRIEEAIEFRVPHDIYAAVHGELAKLKAALAARQPVVAVPQGCDACERTGIRQNDEGRNVFCPDCDLGRASAGDTSHPVGRSFQAGVAEWMGQCFLPSLYSNMTERGDRLLEEVLELLQAHGYDKARVPSLVDYVFGRSVGEPAQEVGGVMVTLAGYCWVAGLDMHIAGDAELARITQPEVVAKIRAKQEAKNALHFDTPLPGSAARQPVGETVDTPGGKGKREVKAVVSQNDLHKILYLIHALKNIGKKVWLKHDIHADDYRAATINDAAKVANGAIDLLTRAYSALSGARADARVRRSTPGDAWIYADLNELSPHDVAILHDMRDHMAARTMSLNDWHEFGPPVLDRVLALLDSHTEVQS